MTELNRPEQNPVKQNPGKQGQSDERKGRPDPEGEGNLDAQGERDPDDAELQGEDRDEEIEARGNEETAEGTERPNNVRNANVQKHGDKGRQQS